LVSTVPLLRERDAQLLEAEPGRPRSAPHRDENDVERHVEAAAIVLKPHAALAIPHRGSDRKVTRQHADPLLLETLTHQGGHFVVLALEQAIRLLRHRDDGAEAGEGLRQLAGDRPPAQDEQPLRHPLQPP